MERNTPISPLSDHNVSSANGVMTSYEYMRARGGVTPDQILAQSVVPANFNTVPVSRQYTSENGVETWTSPIDTKTTSTSFSEYSPTPSSAQSNPAYFPDSTSPTYHEVANIRLNEPMQYSQDTVAIIPNPTNQLVENIPNGSINDQRYSLGPTSAPEQQLQYSAAPLLIAQHQSPSMAVAFDSTPQYSILDISAQFYPMPDWYPNIKPEDTWAGPLPSQSADYFDWNC